jgi:hypothetical protein
MIPYGPEKTPIYLSPLWSASNRWLFGITKGLEEEFGQKIKAWYNGIKDRDFEDIRRVPRTGRPC